MTTTNLRAATVKAAVNEAAREARAEAGDFGTLVRYSDGEWIRKATEAEAKQAFAAARVALDPYAPFTVPGIGLCVIAT